MRKSNYGIDLLRGEDVGVKGGAAHGGHVDQRIAPLGNAVRGLLKRSGERVNVIVTQIKPC